METIGLIAAMPQESAALLRCIHGGQRITLGPFSGKIFELSGLTCVLVTSGMGVRRASEAARELVEISPPRLLISFGIAGAVEADLEIGDVVAIKAFCKLVEGVPSPLLPLKPWLEPALEAASQVLGSRGTRLFNGTAVTNGGSQILGSQLREMEHPVLEMETAGIAQVAMEKGIPLLSMRAISDGPRAPLPFDLGEIMDKDANLRLSKILMAIVRKPSIILRFSELMRNSRLAADNAAIALIAAIGFLAF
jgi:nucleoside phosphorylase